MVLNFANLELRDLDRLSRHELMDVVRTSRAHLPADLVARAEQLPADHLRVLILTARLVCVLRHLHGPEPAPDDHWQAAWGPG